MAVQAHRSVFTEKDIRKEDSWIRWKREVLTWMSWTWYQDSCPERWVEDTVCKDRDYFRVNECYLRQISQTPVLIVYIVILEFNWWAISPPSSAYCRVVTDRRNQRTMDPTASVTWRVLFFFQSFLSHLYLPFYKFQRNLKPNLFWVHVPQATYSQQTAWLWERIKQSHKMLPITSDKLL